jgi:hypothetical protein
MNAIQLFEEAKRLPAKDQSGYISARIPETLAGSSISVWRRGDSISNVGWRVLIGFAPYSRQDLEPLDRLKETLGRSPSSQDSVQVFDALTCTSMSDFDAHIPGVGPVYQTPVVGIWENGVLVEKASGAKATHLIITRCGLTK